MVQKIAERIACTEIQAYDKRWTELLLSDNQAIKFTNLSN